MVREERVYMHREIEAELERFEISDGWEQLTREDGEEILGYSWTNVASISIDRSTTISRLMAFTEELQEKGYRTSICEEDNTITVDVSTSSDVSERIEDKVILD